MGLRASISTRRAAVVLIVAVIALSLTVTRAVSEASAAVTAANDRAGETVFTPSNPAPARILLMGDSVMDQQGNAAAFLLRQAGVNARAIGLWGSGLLTVDQYDDGETKPSGVWLARAAREIAQFDPDVVGVYLNHNYWPPFPRDAAGQPITDLWSDAGQQMIAQQARALIAILRARGARVFFVAPIPAGVISDPDPDAWNPIWHGYLPVLRAERIPVAVTARPLEAADGLRAETRPSCDGTPQQVRPPDDLHLTRFGAGLAGTQLAAFTATLVHADLGANAAPGDRTAALVPTRDGRGYWLIGCEGSVYHFGSAPPLPGARAALAGHGEVVAAVAAPSGAGLWLVASDGEIAAVGDAPSLAFTERPAAPITGATGVGDRLGLWATSASGAVLAAGDAPPLPDRTWRAPPTPVVGIAATPDGDGYWLASADGTVQAAGDTPAMIAPATGASPVVGIAATPDGRGYWLATADGGVHTGGDAPFRGTGRYIAPPPPYDEVTRAPGPAAGVVAAPRPAGYWIFGTTGRVVARGTARHLGGDNNLALFTQ